MMFAGIKAFILRRVMQKIAAKHQPKILPKDVKNIALWQFGGVGDMLLATPVIEALGQRFPEAKIEIWCSNPSFAIFLQQFSGVISIHLLKVYDFDMRTLMKKKVREELCMVRKEMQREHVDLLVNLHVPALLDWWAVEWWLLYKLQPSFTLGFDPSFIVHGSLLDISLNASERDHKHYSKLYQQLVNKAGIKCSLQTTFPVTKKEFSNAHMLLEQSNLIKERHWICMHMGGRRLKVENKMWAIDRFSDLAKRLLLNGFQIVLIGVESERDLGEQLYSAVPDIVNMIGCTSLGEMAALIDQAHGFIGHDSGPFHIAVAVGTPALAICPRPDAESEYLDYQKDNVAVVQGDTPDLITVDDVYQKAKSLLA